jgi:hypothetical protein
MFVVSVKGLFINKLKKVVNISLKNQNYNYRSEISYFIA